MEHTDLKDLKISETSDMLIPFLTTKPKTEDTEFDDELPRQWLPKIFVSGGQVGADSIPLKFSDTHKDVSIEGYMPKGFERDDGKGKEIAEKYGLKEGEGGYSWKDESNARMSDMLIAFLTTKPKTGRGTMQTASVFIRDFYRNEDKTFVPIERPLCHLPSPNGLISLETCRYKMFMRGVNSLKPVYVIWNLEEDFVPLHSRMIKHMFTLFKPNKVMFSGPTLKTQPNIEELGVKLLEMVYDSTSK